jgi:stage V sporulation protein G
LALAAEARDVRAQEGVNVDRGLEITSIRVSRSEPSDGILKAYVSIVLNRVFEIRNLKVIEGKRGLFISMPARRNRNGGFSDIVHPMTQATRDALERAILAAYCGDDWRPPEGTAVGAWVRPPPDDLIGRAALRFPRGPSGSHEAA